MDSMNLEPCDVTLFVNEGKGWISRFSRWAIGPFDHVAMYLGKAFDHVPFLYESDGRGASIENVQHHTGRLVRIMRPDIDAPRKAAIINEAVRIASDDQSYYDYEAIVRFCVPMILNRKFPWLPRPPQYKRDKFMICSEAVAEVFWRAGIDVLPKDVVPLPGDFVTSPILYPVGEGRLFEDTVTF
jgi:hypothetical protein